MSGETESSVSGWTVDTLHEYIEQRFNYLHVMLDERQAAQKVAMETAFAAADKAVTSALLAAEKAVGKAEVAAEKRFDAVNEFRGQLADQARTFMPRAESEASTERNRERTQELAAIIPTLFTRPEADAIIKRNTERIQELTDRFNQGEGRLVDPQAFRTLEAQAGQTAGRGAGLHQAWIYLSGLIVLAVAVYGALKP